MEPLNTFSTDLSIGALQPASYLGSRPLRVNKRTGDVQVMTKRGLTVNSLLRRDEWQLLDTRVQQAALTRLRAVEDLRGRGLTVPIGSFGTLTYQWNQASEMTQADISMTGQIAGERDRVDFKIAGRPVPIVYKDFMIPERTLESARLLGNQLDTAHATAAARVVAEKLEDMLVNGSAATIFDGNTIYGYTTETNRNTDTAANYGGGDWGTISNVVPTVEGMISAANTDRHYGPFVLYASTTQYNQATLNFYTDGSGQTPRDRIMQMPMVEDLRVLDTLADGAILLVQMSEDVVQWAEHMMTTVVEWMSADGMVAFFRVMAVAVPLVKSEYNSRSGIVHATAA
jgi:uncharacterized linocin/CFP29 family protein